MKKRFLLGAVAALALAGLAYGQSITGSLQQSQDPRGNFGVSSVGDLTVQNQAHVNSLQISSPPVVSTCTGGTLVAGSSDLAGGVSGVTGTACTVTFGRPYTNAPTCVFSGSNGTAATVSGVVTAAHIVFAFTTASSATITWICIGNAA